MVWPCDKDLQFACDLKNLPYFETLIRKTKTRPNLHPTLKNKVFFK